MKNITLLILLFLSSLILPQESHAQLLRSGPQVTTFHSDIDDSEQPYGIFIPQNFNRNSKYPLVVMLHGAGSNHRLALRRVFGESNKDGETDVEASKYFPPFIQKDFIVVTPYARGTAGYQGIAEKDVLDVLADVKKRFQIDEDRIYLTGLSMGGGGSLWMGLSYPDIWAAIAPVCPAPQTGTQEKQMNAFNILMYFYQGGADGVVPAEGTQEWVAAMKAHGVNVEYEEYEGVKHDSWVNAYKGAQVFDWFSKHTRNRYPDQVKFATQLYRHQTAYWLTINEFNVGTNATIDAAFNGENDLVIATEQISSFTLDLRNHPKFKAKKKVKFTIDGKKVKESSNGKFTFVKSGNSWSIGNFAPAGMTKKDRQEGPMKDVISDRHIYVYGTADDPSEEELAKRREVAEQAANWSYYRGEFLGRIMVFPRVLKDSEVRASDWKESNLIVFGDKNSNSIIDQIGDRVPLELESSEDYGMAFIYPNGDRYVLVNSGIRIMDAPDNGNEIDGLSRYASPKILLALAKFKDFVIYDKKEVLVNGYFQNDWSVSEKDKKRLKKIKEIVIK